MVRNPPANAGGTRDAGSVPGWGIYAGGGNGSHFSIIAWKIPWIEQPGRPQSMGSQRGGHN